MRYLILTQCMKALIRRVSLRFMHNIRLLCVILKKLITITETKNLVLANITGYDVSYISKWVNGVKLPATKYIEQINEKLAKCFAEAVITSGRTDELSVLFAVPVTRETAEFEILQQLSAAYRFSMKHHGRHRQEEPPPPEGEDEGKGAAEALADALLARALEEKPEEPPTQETENDAI